MAASGRSGEGEADDGTIGLLPRHLAEAGALERAEQTVVEVVDRMRADAAVDRVRLDDPCPALSSEVDRRGEQLGVEALAAVLLADDEAAHAPDRGVVERLLGGGDDRSRSPDAPLQRARADPHPTGRFAVDVRDEARRGTRGDLLLEQVSPLGLIR